MTHLEVWEPGIEPYPGTRPPGHPLCMLLIAAFHAEEVQHLPVLGRFFPPSKYTNTKTLKF